MSEEKTSAEGTKKKSGSGRFTNILLNLWLILMTVVFIGLAVDLTQDLGRFINRHWDVPFLKPLVGARFNADLPVQAPEYGYVVEPMPVEFMAARENLFGLRRKMAFRGVVNREFRGKLVNILSVSKAGDETHWVFNGNGRAVLETMPVFGFARIGAGEPAQIAPVLAVAMVVAEQDTNKSGDTEASDRVSLYIYRLDDKVLQKILTADRITVDVGLSGQDWRVFYQNGLRTFVATYSAPDFTLLKRAPIANMPKMAAEGEREFVAADD